MKSKFTKVIQQDKGWWIGWVQEISGVNSQGKIRAELVRNLRSALKEELESNRADAAAIERAPQMSKDALVIINLSGRGDKDVMQVASKVGLQMPK